jgi:hypothetical protein
VKSSSLSGVGRVHTAEGGQRSCFACCCRAGVGVLPAGNRCRVVHGVLVSCICMDERVYSAGAVYVCMQSIARVSWAMVELLHVW